MGTGIVSILLQFFSTIYPRHEPLLRILSIIFFVLNVFFFAVISVTTILRYSLYPQTWLLMVRHPVQSLFLGAIPMGFATIINMFVNVCVPAWGGRTIQVAWALWWIDAAVSILCNVWLPFQMIITHKNRPETMTAAWLLPIVAPIVSAASGALVASALPNPSHALWTLITSYVLWATGIPLALAVLVIYFHRLTMHSLPPQEAIVSVFLPLGPLGQGGYAAMKLGLVARTVFPLTRTLHPLAGDVFYVLGFAVAMVLWGFGLVWLFFAVAGISHSRRFPFNMGWWGFTFPLGVYAMATLVMGTELPSGFFRVLGTVFGICVVVLWLIVAVGTLRYSLKGALFEAPCLREMEKAKGFPMDWVLDRDSRA
ncbi:C4-dicarboxylate transporter/malic acid transport protein [Westerdykella ornata]|uniref:C4-dicarboxylate transporter/malic acid transport protein n=1 Tax=Westerdykella ornata TaxID=318751 RepID=A0A6A6JTR5_WESOR|nr:C4-dicarboxylate transporter/malic acid transport protein [Westerdykella ornata]KAF2279962.1 C4-dicarboxylate transporter/malic acid transport protein [Westerdykella ornata]